MRRLYPDAVVQGIIGGIAAGAVVAGWFFVRDLIAGSPFSTPTALAMALVGGTDDGTTFQLVLTYTVLHFGVFAVLGVVAAGMVHGFEIAPGVLLGAGFGLGVLNTVHYGALLLTGRDVLTILPTFHVLGANLVGGIVLGVFLHWAIRSERPLGLGILRDHPALVRGMVTGVIGATTVAIWFLVLDIVGGRPFYTPAALGSVVFLGATSGTEIEQNAGIVAAYSVLHLVAFAVVGTVLVWGAERIQRAPGMWLLGFLAFVLLEALFLGAVGTLSQGVLGSLGWWAIGVGNLLAILAMGGWIWHTHPKLRQEFLEVPVDTHI